MQNLLCHVSSVASSVEAVTVFPAENGDLFSKEANLHNCHFQSSNVSTIDLGTSSLIFDGNWFESKSVTQIIERCFDTHSSILMIPYGTYFCPFISEI